MFRNRSDAGHQLAHRLEPFNTPETLLLAIPRGGIEVAYPIALHLKKPLDVIIPRKIVLPDDPELALGAVTFDGDVEIDASLVEKLRLTPADVDGLVGLARLESERRLSVYRGGEPSPELKDKDLILIDDGLATGYTMTAAVKSVLRETPRRVVVAVPVSPVMTCEQLQSLGETVVVVVLHLAQQGFFAVGSFYGDFRDLSESELVRMLRESNVAFRKSVPSGEERKRETGE